MAHKALVKPSALSATEGRAGWASHPAGRASCPRKSSAVRQLRIHLGDLRLRPVSTGWVQNKSYEFLENPWLYIRKKNKWSCLIPSSVVCLNLLLWNTLELDLWEMISKKPTCKNLTVPAIGSWSVFDPVNCWTTTLFVAQGLQEMYTGLCKSLGEGMFCREGGKMVLATTVSLWIAAE